MTATKPQTQTKTAVRTKGAFDRALRQADLPALEENVLRMRYGITLTDDAPLHMRGDSHPEAREELLRLEQRALAALDTAVDADRRDAIIARMRKI